MSTYLPTPNYEPLSPRARTRARRRLAWLTSLAAIAITLMTQMVQAQDAEITSDNGVNTTGGVIPIQADRPIFSDTAQVIPFGYSQVSTGYEAMLYEGETPNLQIFDFWTYWGVGDLIEVRVGLDYLHLRDGDTGLGDLTVGLKGGFFGGYGDRVDLAVLVDVVFPTATESYGMDGGVGLRSGVVVSYTWRTLIFDLQALVDSQMFGAEFGLSLPISLGVSWAALDRLYVYGDVLERLDFTNLSESETSLAAGAGYRVIPQIELNAGARLGLSQSLPDVGFEVGATWLIGQLW